MELRALRRRGYHFRRQVPLEEYIVDFACLSQRLLIGVDSPARFSAVRTQLRRLHHAAVGLTPKTLANHKSNTKASLLWLARGKSVCCHGMPLTTRWEHLRDQLMVSQDRYRLSPLMRYCSARALAPQAVDETVLADYYAYRSREMARPTQQIQKATGLRATTHQFRHAAGALLLKKYPGNYELVRRVLGHRSIETTINSYCGLENIQASEIFGSLIREQLSQRHVGMDN